MWCSTSLLLLLGYVTAQEFKEDQYSSKINLKEIPKGFEIKGKNSKDMISKYVTDIQRIANEHNLTVLYKVKVDVTKPKPKPKKSLKKITFKKIKSKKYNVPLKKQSMKLSNFEILLRKIAEENGLRNKMAENRHVVTTENLLLPQFYNSNQKLIKFKPIVKRVKTNFTKIVKPVRNKIITLSSF